MLNMLFGRGGSRPASTEEKDVTPAEARQHAQAGALLLDVREPAEWQAGHAPGATLIPLGQLSAKLKDLPKDREIITVCRSGNRSGVAAGMLRSAGFTQVRNMVGGMNSWAKSGLPVER